MHDRLWTVISWGAESTSAKGSSNALTEPTKATPKTSPNNNATLYIAWFMTVGLTEVLPIAIRAKR